MPKPSVHASPRLSQIASSSTSPSQSSSTPLHTSVPAIAACALHCVPVVSSVHSTKPKRWHAPSPSLHVAKRVDAHASSVVPLQSSSM